MFGNTFGINLSSLREVRTALFGDVCRKMRCKVSYVIVIHYLVEDTLVRTRLALRYCNLDSFGLLYLKMCKPLFPAAMLIKEQEIYLGGMRCLSTTSKRWR